MSSPQILLSALPEKESFQMTCKTFFGLENVLANELQAIGAKEIKTARRSVYFSGDKSVMYKANYCLRTALNVLVPFCTFYAKDENELYNEVYNIAWENYFTLKHTFAIETTINSDFFKHSQYAALKTKDAIVDYFRAKTGKRPFIDAENPQILIHLHISDKTCTLSLNSSGEPLFKRGYKVSNGAAPINEILAAGMLKLSGWTPKHNLFDPMCGSGTILIEAAMIAENIAPGVFRKQYSFENWSNFESKILEGIAEQEHDNNPKDLPVITGIDISGQAIHATNKNLQNSFLNNYIKVENKDFFECKKPFEKGFIITNPPYGEKFKNNSLSRFYAQIGDKLKNSFTNFETWIISPDKEALKFIGLHPEKKVKLFNGPLECSFNKYTVYEGSKKQYKNNLQRPYQY
ncbi:MAG TPA: THUMP domain-containing protein [Bacteroidales bacterium]|nr:THUMP domain-containing protein [Bacteroidales bacterium]